MFDKQKGHRIIPESNDAWQQWRFKKYFSSCCCNICDLDNLLL